MSCLCGDPECTSCGAMMGNFRDWIVTVDMPLPGEPGGPFRRQRVQVIEYDCTLDQAWHRVAAMGVGEVVECRPYPEGNQGENGG